ncbi:MAG: SIR2 family protein [Akkermansiaceae bacterium]|nr:SIR2 family protein [Akkermansiaceae bacterium]
MTESEANNKNETSQGVKTLLLVGNSPNLVDEFNSKAEWSRMLNDLRRGLEDYLDGIEESASFPQIMQAIGNLYRMHGHIEDENNTGKKIEDQLINWFYEVGHLAPTAIHRMLVALKFDCYLTTNYDFALDKALSKSSAKFKFSYKEDNASVIKKFFEEGKPSKESVDTRVYHIHGKISDPASMIMSPRSYQIAVGELDKYWRESRVENSIYGWLKPFCTADVHICGFTLRPEESIFWYALEQRFLEIQEKRIADSYPRTFVYLFYKEGNADDEKEKKALEALLKTYAVTTVFIPVRGGDYVSAWKQLIGEILLRKNKWAIYHRSSKSVDQSEKLSDELIECLQKTESGGGRKASRGKNMSTAFTNHYKFLNHCLFELSESKRANIKRLGRWLCYCKIDGRAHMYEFSDSRQLLFLCPEDGSKSKVPVLVNYKTGELFCLSDEQNKMTSLGKGCEINDIEDFVNRINVPK